MMHTVIRRLASVSTVYGCQHHAHAVTIRHDTDSRPISCSALERLRTKTLAAVFYTPFVLSHDYLNQGKIIVNTYTQ